MAERRVDRVAEILEEHNGRAQLRDVVNSLKEIEGNDAISSSSVYVAVQAENDRLEQLGERPRFRTFKHGEQHGWMSLQPQSKFSTGSIANRIEQEVLKANKRVDDDIKSHLEQMDWRTFESTFLTAVLEKLGFQDVVITQATRDGGTDARVAYERGIVEANAIVSAKRWASRSVVAVEEVRLMRGVQGDEDTAIIVTTGKFSADAKKEARPSQNQRVVYLIDGERLVEICKQHGIGVEKVTLPELLFLNAERFLPPSDVDDDESSEDEVNESGGPRRRFREAYLGDDRRGLSAIEIADVLGLAEGTVRSYLSDPVRKRGLAERIRADGDAKARALEIVNAKARSGGNGTDADIDGRRLHVSMLGDAENGLSVAEIVALVGLAETTVRSYLSIPDRKAELANRIRQDPSLRAKALAAIAKKRSND